MSSAGRVSVVHRLRSVPRAWVLVWLLAVSCTPALAGASDLLSAGCQPFEGGGTLSVDGLVEIEFARFATDRARDLVMLSGGVCVQFVDASLRLRVESLDLRGLQGVPQLSAREGVLESAEGTLAAPRFEVDLERVVAVDAFLVSAQYLAFAERFELPLASPGLRAYRVRMATEQFWIDAESALLVGGALEAFDVWFTTCACPPGLASSRIEAARVMFKPGEEALTVEDGRFVSPLGAGLLPSPFVLSADVLKLGQLPVAFGPDRTLVYSSPIRTRAPGVRLGWSLASPLFEVDPNLVLQLEGQGDPARFDMLLDERGFRLGWSLVQPIAVDWSAALLQRFDARSGAQSNSQELRFFRRWEFERESPGLAAATLEVGPLLGVASERRDGRVVQDARLGVFAQANLVGQPSIGLTPGLVASLGMTRYPAAELAQATLALRPSVELAWGAWRGNFAHSALWVSGASPFSASIDGASAAQRSEWGIDGSLRSEWGSLAVTHRAAWDYGRPSDGVVGGFARLDTDANLQHKWGAFSGGVFLSSVLARALDPSRGAPPKLDLEASLKREPWAFSAQLDGLALWKSQRPDVQVSVRFDAAPWRASFAWRGDARTLFGGSEDRGRFHAVVDWSADAAGVALSAGVRSSEQGWDLTSLQFGAGFPLTFGPLSLRPEFAVELTTLARRGWTLDAFASHGLTVEWAFDVATLSLGYRFEREKPTTAQFSLRLPLSALDVERFRAALSVPLRGR